MIEPTASVVAPFQGSTIDVSVANGDMDLTGSGNPTTGPHYIDVVYTPPTGTMLDYSSIYSGDRPDAAPSAPRRSRSALPSRSR